MNGWRKYILVFFGAFICALLAIYTLVYSNDIKTLNDEWILCLYWLKLKGKNTEKYSHSTFCGKRMMRNQTNTYMLSMFKWINKMKIEMDKKNRKFPTIQHRIKDTCKHISFWATYSSVRVVISWHQVVQIGFCWRKVLRNNFLELWSFHLAEYSCGIKSFKRDLCLKNLNNFYSEIEKWKF